MPIKTSVWTSEVWGWPCPVLWRVWKQKAAAGPFLDHKIKPFLITLQHSSASLTVAQDTGREEAAAREITDLHKWFGNCFWVLGMYEILSALPHAVLRVVRECWGWLLAISALICRSTEQSNLVLLVVSPFLHLSPVDAHLWKHCAFHVNKRVRSCCRDA